MKIEAVDAFYLSMPEVLDIGDGSQDAFLVRVRADDQQVGWGEGEAAPLPSLAGLVCPMSHSACHPVLDSVLGERLDGPADIARITTRVRERSLDLLQADHILSGVEIALWDLLGRAREVPVWRMLGYERACAKLPYASVLFGEEPAETLAKARAIAAAGFGAAKFGWGPYGRGSVRADADQVAAAREGLGLEPLLLVDAGTVWREDVEAAELRLPALQAQGVTWLEEPFIGGALAAHRRLAAAAAPVKLAGGEGSHNEYQAFALIDHGDVGYIQIDAGRIGGLGPAKCVADYAVARGVTYVNHTFTSHLALSASLQPYAGLADHRLCEYPTELKPLAAELASPKLALDANGELTAPDAPGLGVEPDLDIVRRYLVEVEITVAGRSLYRTPVV